MQHIPAWHPGDTVSDAASKYTVQSGGEISGAAKYRRFSGFVVPGAVFSDNARPFSPSCHPSCRQYRKRAVTCCSHIVIHATAVMTLLTIPAGAPSRCR
ncbi:MAG: hypothetical protein KIG22_03470 [Oxalobacter sp.]|nr:hypothetical protein [Oxalobacter sp.]